LRFCGLFYRLVALAGSTIEFVLQISYRGAAFTRRLWPVAALWIVALRRPL
jgi:hypothetical protein